MWSAWLSAALGVLAVAALPAAVWVAEVSQRVDLLHGAAVIPLAVLLAIPALLLATRVRRRLQWSLGGSRGAVPAGIGRALGVLGLGLAITAAIAVGFYGLLVALQ